MFLQKSKVVIQLFQSTNVNNFRLYVSIYPVIFHFRSFGSKKTRSSSYAHVREISILIKQIEN